jgi:hypothetical protein
MEITNLKEILARGAATSAVKGQGTRFFAAGEKLRRLDCKPNVNRESFLKI